MITENIIRKDGDGWSVYSEDGSKHLGGPYKSKAQAHKRLAEVEYFKAHKGTNNMDSSLDSITFNLDSKALRYQTLNGKNYAVVPMVMLTEGVHHGSEGRFFYPEKELAKTPVVWNTKPIVIYHPEQNGQGISACTPEVMEKRGVGMVMNTIWAKKLKAEAWLEVDRLNAVDPSIMPRIVKNETIEVSTGLFNDKDWQPGVWNGEEYDATVTNYRPDHLAILPDVEGACSMKDGCGCGLSRNTNNAIHKTIHDLINPAGTKTPKVVHDVFDDVYIYGEPNGSLYSQPYEVDDTKKHPKTIKHTGNAVEVKLHQEYRRVGDGSHVGNATTKNSKEVPMVKKDIVDRIIANSHGVWLEADRSWLTELEEDQLTKMERTIGSETNIDPASKKGANKKRTDTDTDEETDQDIEEKKGKGGTKNAKKKPPKDDDEEETPSENKAQTTEEYISSAPPDVQRILRNAIDSEKREKTRLVDIIVANKNNKFTKEALTDMPVGDLEAIAALAAPEKVSSTPRYARYLGANTSDPVTANSDVSDEVLPRPSLNGAWDKTPASKK